MAEWTLYIWDHNYSSWSLRGYLCTRLAGITPEIVNLSEHDGEELRRLREMSPTRLFPLLVHDTGGEPLRIWESSAIAEYLAERFPEAPLWPTEPRLRALARSVTAQMHAGFSRIRSTMPMNIRASYPGTVRPPEVREEIQQVLETWRLCQSVAERGPFLFGDYCVADAFFAPVVLRFVTYDVALDPGSRAYVEAQLEHPFLREWTAQAKIEQVVRPQYEFAR
jgi:glutathione S-transferase